MSSWANKFKNKEALQRDQVKKEIAGWAVKIEAYSKEVMSGAPGKDFQGVRILKNSLEIAQREKAKLERKLAKL